MKLTARMAALAGTVQAAAELSRQFTHPDREGRRLTDRIREQMAGQPGAANYEGDQVSGHTTVVDDRGIPMPALSDPTGETAIRRDRAAADLRELDRHMAAMHRHATQAVAIAALYTPRPATALDRRTLAALNIKPDPGCQSCDRVGSWSIVHRSTTLGGRLPAKTALCHWCYRWANEHGQLPAVDVMERHARGETIRQRAS